MKKYVACLLVAASLLTLGACAFTKDEDAPMTTETTTEGLVTTAYCDGGCTTTREEIYPATGYNCCGTPHDGECETTTTVYEFTGGNGGFTSSRDDIAPLYPEVHLYSADGRELAYYSELVWLMDGMLIGDGALIFMSVSSRLPAIEDMIPLVELGGTPEIRLSAREGVTVQFKNTVNVYGEDYLMLAENVPLESLWERGNAEWQGREVYVYFTATFSDDTPDYEKITCNGYFVKVKF